MSAREAYIAGRSGGSRPPTKQTRGSDPSETQRNTQQQDREQKSFDAGQQERQREQTIKQEGIQGLSQRDQEQAKTIAQNVAKQGIFKDPYNTLTREEQIDAGYPKTGIETLGSLSLDDIIDKAPSLLLKGIAGGAKGLQLLLDKAFKPELKDFSNPNFLAVLDAAFKSGKLNKDQYTQKYEDLLNDVYSGQAKENLEAGIGGLDSEGLFDLAMEEATANVEPGSGTQRITNPEGFYIDDGKSIMPQTTGGLENLANLDAQQYLQGENYNPELAKMIFNARATLDQNKGNQGGGGSGIMGTQMAQQTGTTNPGYDMSIYGSRIGQKGPFTADFVDQDGDGSDDRYQSGPGQGGPKAIPKENFIGGREFGGIDFDGGGIGRDNMGIRGGVPSLTPTSIDYASMGPQYGGYVNQGISDPRFASYFQNLQMFPRRS